jgi:hypothetical protein
MDGWIDGWVDGRFMADGEVDRYIPIYTDDSAGFSPRIPGFLTPRLVSF